MMQSLSYIEANMHNPFELSGKISLEYLIHCFECLETHGSASDYFIFSQSGVELLELRYKPEQKIFEIKILNLVSEDQFNGLIDAFFLKRKTHIDENIMDQTLTGDVSVDVARALLFGPYSLLNAEKEFELDCQFAQKPFSKTMLDSQFFYPPFPQIALLILWAVYEIVRTHFLKEDSYFAIGNIDMVEAALTILCCYLFWGTWPNKNDIPVFSDGISKRFLLYKNAIFGCMSIMIALVFVSLFTP